MYFLQEHRSEMLATRASLLSQLEETSLPLARVVERLFEARDKLDPPAVGEAWPWLVADLANLSNEKVRDVAKAWLALYTYALLLDETCDESGANTDPSTALAGALLFESGVGDFYELTHGSRWHYVARRGLRDAIRYQETDVRDAGNIRNLGSKRKAAAGKNTGFVLCTAALAATNKIDGDVLDRFARSVLLAFQHLDDIADFEVDWRSRNFTPILVSGGDQVMKLDPKGHSKREVLIALISSGALQSVLTETRDDISAALTSARSVFHTRSRSGASVFLAALISNLCTAIEAAEKAFIILRSSDPNDREAALIRVEQRLRVVAQQS